MQQKTGAQKKSPRSSRSKALRKSVSVLGISFIILTGFYILAGLILNPRFFIVDAREKIGIVKGVMVSVRVVGEPGKPEVTAEAECDALSSKVTLAWDETIDTTSYDIERDGLSLVTGLAGISYEDASVDNETAYSYVVIAQGPRGSTASNPAVIETPDCTNNISANGFIVTIEGKNITRESGIISISSRQPTFSGTTNVPNANIILEIASTNPTIVNLTANSNGYWSWNVPFNLSLGLHRITLIVTDPVYNWRTATDTKYFKIISKEEEKEEKTQKNKKEISVPVSPSVPPNEIPLQGSSQPLELNLEVLNPEGAAYIGGGLNLESVVTPKEISIPQELELLYRVYASNQEEILFQQKEVVTIKSRDPESFFHTLSLPVLLHSGRYIISVQTTAGGSFISSQASFEVKEVPLFSIGSLNVTWSMIMEVVSWVIWGLLIIILIFLGLLELEHHRAAKALFQITENILARKGYFTRRKGVSQ